MLAVAAAAGSTTAVADAAPKSPSRHSVTKRVTARIPLAIAVAKAKEAAPRTVNDDPPPECDEQVQLAVTAGYTDNVLTDTVSHYDGQVYCAPANDLQTMRHLSDNAQLAVGSNIVDQGPVGECSHEPGQTGQCLWVDSASEHDCLAGTACAGEYQAANYYTELLPDGWIWVQVPSNCQSLGDEEIICRDFTQPIIGVSPIYS